MKTVSLKHRPLFLVLAIGVLLNACVQVVPTEIPTPTIQPSPAPTATETNECPQYIKLGFSENTIGLQDYTNLVQSDFPIISRKVQRESLPDRVAYFSDTLRFEIEHDGPVLYKIKNSSQYSLGLGFYATFQNSSSTSITFFPEWFFENLGWGPTPLMVIVSNEETSKGFPEFDFVEATWDSQTPRGLEDLVLIEPGKTLSAYYFLTISYIRRGRNNYIDGLSTGEYEAQAIYENIWVGIPLGYGGERLEFDSYEEEETWLGENYMYLDVNLWVGKIKSNTVKFEVPSYDDLQMCIDEMEGR